jgi:hypothetical protein
MASVLSRMLPKGTETWETLIRITVSLLVKNIHTSEISSVATTDMPCLTQFPVTQFKAYAIFKM